MPARTKDADTTDLPGLDGADLKVVRFGTGAAILILLFIVALAAVAVTVALRDHVGVAERSQAPSIRMPVAEGADPQAPPAAEAAPVEASMTSSAAPADDGSAPAEASSEVSPQQQERNKKIDRAFAALDRTSIPAMREFLRRFDSVKHAEDSGYLTEVSDALQVAMAREAEEARLTEEQEQEEERKRKQEQQAVPWDMGVEPPAAGN